jgi:hypothetical protein
LRAYSASDEETLHARNLLKDWAGQGLLTEAQYQRMEQETIFDNPAMEYVSELRRTNIFLRLVLFLFTLIIVGGAVALFFVGLSPPEGRTTGIFLLIFAAISYAAAELAVSQARLYRYGIEEALAACSVGFLCAGLQVVLFSGRLDHSPMMPYGMRFLIPAAGAVTSLWIWHRFRLWYASLAAMIFVIWLPHSWTSSSTAQHLIVLAFYTTGLITVAALRSPYRFGYRNHEYSIVEALLWLGIYVAINLRLSSMKHLGEWWDAPRTNTEFSMAFYWTTWVLIWCLPPVILARGLRRKDRFVIGVGALVAILTLATNKPYLGWQRQTWDPMLLGVLLIGVALLIRRWLAHGPGGIRHGFTAQRLSAKDKQDMDAASMALGVISPSITQSQQTRSDPGVRFGGGDSGGGGASSDF